MMVAYNHPRWWPLKMGPTTTSDGGLWPPLVVVYNHPWWWAIANYEGGFQPAMIVAKSYLWQWSMDTNYGGIWPPLMVCYGHLWWLSMTTYDGGPQPHMIVAYSHLWWWCTGTYDISLWPPINVVVTYDCPMAINDGGLCRAYARQNISQNVGIKAVWSLLSSLKFIRHQALNCITFWYQFKINVIKNKPSIGFDSAQRPPPTIPLILSICWQHFSKNVQKQAKNSWRKLDHWEKYPPLGLWPPMTMTYGHLWQWPMGNYDGLLPSMMLSYIDLW